MHRSFTKSRVGVASAVMGLLLSSSAWAVNSTSEEFDEGRNFDAREEYNRGISLGMPAAQQTAIAELNRQVPDFAFTWDDQLGVVKTLASDTGYLTAAAPEGMEPLTAAMRFVNANLAALGLTREDISSYRITDSVYSSVTGATHIYLEQMFNGIPVDGASLQVHVNRDGRILSVNNLFVSNLRDAVNVERAAISAPIAMVSALNNIGVTVGTPPQAATQAVGRQQIQTFAAGALSTQPMTARLVYVPIRGGEVRLAWNMGTMWTADGQHTYTFNVDAQNGQVWTRSDTTSSASYRAYQLPVESPLRSTPASPTDGRTLIVNPENATASPRGWLTTANLLTAAEPNANPNVTIRIATAPLTGAAVTCPGGTCTFPLNLNVAPNANTAAGQNNQRAAAVNAFYLANSVHDIQFLYGFNEAAGNFQTTNTRGGVGSDNVIVNVQASGQCNANFSTPADGGNGRMNMFLCNRATPSHDGDFDAGVLIHEYGHGISTRQVGGPARSCLGGQQQAGEGWSDWFGLVYTGRVGETGLTVRGTGNYLFGMPANGNGIRNLPYTTDNARNNWTYESIRTAGLPHGVGSRWAQAIWEVYWALVDARGFEPNLLAFDGPQETAGNKRALFYINEGLKLTACNPTFINNRDAIMRVVTDNYGGQDVCTVWRAFAGFGLGTDARSANNQQASAINGFAIPAQCQAPNS